MKKRFAANAILSILLVSCGVGSTSSISSEPNSLPSSLPSDPSIEPSVESSEEPSLSEPSSSSSIVVPKNWTEEQIALFNERLGGYILPSIPAKILKFRYFLGDIVIDTEFEYSLDEDYAALLEADGFVCTYYPEYESWSAKKGFSEDQYIFLQFVLYDEDGDSGFQVSAKLSDYPRDREHAWTNAELQLFEEHLDNVVLPFPNTKNVSMRYTTNPSDNYIWITGDYGDDILDSYCSAMREEGFKLSKHPLYGIDVAKKQLPNNRYLEIWIAVADERSGGGGIFFEIMARSHQGSIEVIDDKHIAFGSYPQSEIKPGFAAYDILYDKAVGNGLPTEEDPKEWKVHNDHFASNKKQYSGFYKDIEFMGTKYRALYSTEPRSMSAGQPLHDTEYPYMANVNKYPAGSIYIFEFEPIIWEIMNEDEGIKTLAPTCILDINCFDYHEDKYVLDGKTVYLANYEHSFIREWLNNDFFDFAFSGPEQTRVVTTTVDNSYEQCALTELEEDDLKFLDHDYNDVLSPDTEDQVFLFSRKEMVDYDFGYGEVTNWQNTDLDKCFKSATDYSLARGAIIRSSAKKSRYPRAITYSLRTPNIAQYYAYQVQAGGDYYGLELKAGHANEYLGIFPGINVDLG